MGTADTIGLLPGLGWLAGHSFAWTLTLCLFITPVLHVLIGLVFEGRVVPLRPSRQFLSFFPGDVLLGIAVAGMLTQAQKIPGEPRWFNAWWWHVLVLLVALAIAAWMTRAEARDGVYPRRAMLSPTKLYHNFALYGIYGYVAFVTFVAVVCAAWSWWLLLLVGLPLLLWVGLVVYDNLCSERVRRRRAAYAHVADWRPIWRD